MLAPLRLGGFVAILKKKLSEPHSLYIMCVGVLFCHVVLMRVCCVSLTCLCVVHLLLHRRGSCANNSCNRTRRLGWCFSTLSRPIQVSRLLWFVVPRNVCHIYCGCFCRFRWSHWPPPFGEVNITYRRYILARRATTVSYVRLATVFWIVRHLMYCRFVLARCAALVPALGPGKRARGCPGNVRSPVVPFLFMLLALHSQHGCCPNGNLLFCTRSPVLPSVLL